MNTVIELLDYFPIVIGLGGLAGIVCLCIAIFYYPDVLDRYLAQFKLRTVLMILCFILTIPFSLVLLANVLGITSEGLLYNPKVEPSGLSWAVFHIFSDPGSLSYAATPKDRLFATIAAMLGILLMNGFLVSTILGYYDRHVQGWINGGVRYNLKRTPHILILGGHDSIISIIREIKNKKEFQKAKRIVIMTSRDIPEFRSYLQSVLSRQELKTIILYHGSRTSTEDLNSLHLTNTTILATYVVGEGTPIYEEPAHDSQSLESVKLIAQKCKDRKNRLNCYMMFEKQATYATFQLANFSEDIKANLVFEPYNYYEMWAQQIIAQPNGSTYKAVDQITTDNGEVKEWIHKDSRLSPHIIILGMERMGLAIAQEAALCCHYPNFKHTKITLIDRNADKQMQHFINRAPSLFELSKWSFWDTKKTDGFIVNDNLKNIPENFQYSHLADGDSHFMDVDWEFIKGDIDEQKIVKYLESVSKEEDSIVSVFICLPSDNECLTAAVWLPSLLCKKAQQVLVQQELSYDMIEQLSTQTSGSESRYKNFVPFGKMESSFKQIFVDVPVAKKIYSKNYKQIHKAIGEGNRWQDINWVWDTLSPMERWSAIYSSHGWFTKFRTLGVPAGKIPSKELLTENFCKQEEEETPSRTLFGEVEHNRWVYERLLKVGECAMTDEIFIQYDWENLATQHKEEHNLTKKRIQNSFRREHLDICSLSLLKKVDPDSVAYDMRLERTALIYEALKEDFTA